VIVSDIINKVAKEFDIHPRDLVSPHRFGFIMNARFALYKILHNRGASYAQVGRWCGNRDHTTIRHGVFRADYMIERDPDYRSKIEELTAWCRPQPEPAQGDEQHIHHMH
jgi:chromosomal replication initiator protein